ncbi:MAG TPA: hypothetical protein VNJ31_07960 [Methyloceanibacter sp.]|nr:hypothetical protein [Methyloceanibacter sp.]
MARVSGVPRLAGGRRAAFPTRPLPDPRGKGPFRPFADPGWNEAWWWLGIPLAVAVFTIASYSVDIEWHRAWVTRESGILETAQFIFMVMGLAIVAQLLFDPFVKSRPFVFAFALFAGLVCFYIGGEEVSWGQHIFHWQSPDLVTELNDEGEFSLHNMNKAFERTPRTLLELGVFIGGILVPAACAVWPKLRQASLALFLPCAALVPIAFFALYFKLAGMLAKYDVVGAVAGRPSEAVEFYLYFFIFAYLVVFERRIHALETEKVRADKD